MEISGLYSVPIAIESADSSLFAGEILVTVLSECTENKESQKTPSQHPCGVSKSNEEVTFFSLEFESHLSQIFNSNLRHALTQIPFHPKLAPPNYAIAPLILAFFLSPSLPLHHYNT
ncbi:hypothetical protein CFP56_004805 [Quercus suber]|uniref:Uncharacterized protein n=1 Tax=Quercus suber TaxID=58331 RepID=A0AAW0M6K9_QUESU